MIDFNDSSINAELDADSISTSINVNGFNSSITK